MAAGFSEKIKFSIFVSDGKPYAAMNSKPPYTITGMSPQLLVADLDYAVNFYTQNLGFEVEFRYEDFYCGIIKDGCSIHLKVGAPPIRESDNEHTDLIFSVENIENLYVELASAIEIVQPLRDMPYGKEFYITDPDGYVLAFVE